MKVDEADKVFSQYVRLRDRECVKCHSFVRLNEDGLPISHQASHFFGRRMESVRFDLENVDTLCHGCHHYWEKENREAYREFKVKQLGQKGFDRLCLRAHQTKKKDRAMDYLTWNTALKGL